jgi:hypothetical protein
MPDSMKVTKLVCPRKQFSLEITILVSDCQKDGEGGPCLIHRLLTSELHTGLHEGDQVGLPCHKGSKC